MLMEHAAYAAALALVGTLPDRMRQLHLLLVTLTKLLSTEGRFGRRQLFHNLIGCGAF